jgi:F1F0 ATPase subunit 2
MLTMDGLLVAFVAGLLMGSAYLLALWLSVRRLCRGARPALWLVGSAVLRLATLLAGFYLVMDGQWQRLAACLAGFLLLRVPVTTWLGSAPTRRAGPV